MLTDRRDTAIDAPISESEPAAARGTLGDRREVRAVANVLFAGVVALQVVSILRASPAWLVKRLPDDAFYYLEVGRRLGEGGGFTFDGVHETNGFHPLWQGIVALLSIVAPSDDVFIRLVLLTSVAMSTLAVVLVVRAVSKVVGAVGAMAGGIVALTGALGVWSNAMEGPAVLLSLALVLTATVRWAHAPSFREGIWVGVSLGVAVLARLDLAAVLWIVPAAMIWRARTWRAALGVAVGVALIGVPTGAAWMVRWGHPLTTSATVKSNMLDAAYEDQFGGRATTGYLGFLAETGEAYVRALLQRIGWGGGGGARVLLVPFAVIGAGTAVRAWAARVRTGAGPALSPAAFALGAMVMVTVSKTVVDIVAAPLWAATWYAAPQQLMVLFAFGVAAWKGVEWCAARFPVAGVAIAVLFGLLLVPPTFASALRTGEVRGAAGTWQHELDVAADWIAREGPPGRYGANDAGILGFRLHDVRTLVNLDGLVNSYEYAELLARDHTYGERFEATGVEFFVNRLSADVVADELGCADVLYRSSEPVSYTNSLQAGATANHIYVLDVRSC